MRVILEKTLENGLKATIFGWNGKLIVKLENGWLEQTYKVNETDVAGIKDIEAWLDHPDFQQKVVEIFGQMEQEMEKLF